MGADLVVYHTFMNGVLDKDSEMKDRERRMIDEVNKNLNDDDIAEYKQNLIDYGNYDEDNGDEDVNYPETIKNVIMNFFGCLGGRDVSYLFHNNQTIWFTGGMTYGDDPTGGKRPVGTGMDQQVGRTP